MKKTILIYTSLLLLAGCDGYSPSEEDMLSHVQRSVILASVKHQVLNVDCKDQYPENSLQRVWDVCQVKVKANEDIWKSQNTDKYSHSPRLIFDPIKDKSYIIAETFVKKGEIFSITLTFSTDREGRTTEIFGASIFLNRGISRSYLHPVAGSAMLLKGSKKHKRLIALNDTYRFYRRSITSQYENAKKEPRQSSPTSDFILSQKGWAIHKPTGLMWKRCLEGKRWNSKKSSCTGKATSYRAEYVKKNSGKVLDRNGWRIPNAAEFYTLLEQRVGFVKINNDVFPGLHDYHHGYGRATMTDYYKRRSNIWTTTAVKRRNFKSNASSGAGFFLKHSDYLITFRPDGKVVKKGGAIPNMVAAQAFSGTNLAPLLLVRNSK